METAFPQRSGARAVPGHRHGGTAHGRAAGGRAGSCPRSPRPCQRVLPEERSPQVLGSAGVPPRPGGPAAPAQPSRGRAPTRPPRCSSGQRVPGVPHTLTGPGQRRGGRPGMERRCPVPVGRDRAGGLRLPGASAPPQRGRAGASCRRLGRAGSAAAPWSGSGSRGSRGSWPPQVRAGARRRLSRHGAGEGG